MSENQAFRVDFQKLNKMHQANYAVFQANSDEEVNQAIQNSLINFPFLTAYYTINHNKLERKITFDPRTGLPIKNAPDLIEITSEELEKLSSSDTGINSLDASNLPEVFKLLFSGMKCSQSITLPVTWDGKLTALVIASGLPESLFTPETIDPLIHLTEIIPIAVNNLITTKSTRQHLIELETIAYTSNSISSLTDLESLYKALHARINATTGNVDFTVALYNSQNETIELPYVFENGTIKSIDPFPLGEGVISVLLRTRQPLMFVVDAGRHLNALGAKVVGKPAKSWLGCPLIVASGAIGALILQDLDHENRFDQNDLRLLIALSSQVAGSINNIRLLENARRNSQELQAVAKISQQVSGSHIIDDFLQQAVSLVHEKFDFYHSAIFLLDESGEIASLREASGYAEQLLKRTGIKFGVGSRSIIGFVTSQKEIMVVNDTTKDPDYYTTALLPETKAEACIPLMVGERILGVLDVHSKRPYVFSNENTSILQILADQLSIAIINSELFAEAQERISQHRLLHHITTAAASSSTIQDVLNSAVQGLQVALGGDQISIMMADKEQKTLEVKASAGYPNEESARLKIPFGVGITGWAASNRRSLQIGDTTKDSRYIVINPKVRSELAIPLVYRNEVLGILNVESFRLNAYNSNDEEMLGTLAGSLAAIIAHSRLLDQYRLQVEREHQLTEITNKIRRTTNPELILSITANEINKALNTRRTQVEINIQNTQRNADDRGINKQDNKKTV